MSLDVIILAAGQGSRMKSKKPKVLHGIGGKPMVQHVIDCALELDAPRIHVVVGHGADQVREALDGQALEFALQAEQLGTGHAVAQALAGTAPEGISLVLYGDVPLTRSETLRQLVEIAGQDKLGLLTVRLGDPSGYGRIIRNDADQVVAIVEHKDATEAQRGVNEVNTGILALPTRLLADWLPRLSSNNAQGEYYLTDVIAMAAEQGVLIEAIQPEHEQEVQGVNNRQQQAELERWYQLREAQRLMHNGVTLLDPSRLDVRGSLSVGLDVVIDINCLFEGKVVLGNDVSIGPNCHITDAVIGDGCQIRANSVIDQAQLQENCDIGPFARLRPGTELAAGVKVGNFVETKKARIGAGSKVNHLSYVGDALLGSDVNVGAGTITCNYDGVNKSQTEIGDGAFIGSNSALVAPVTVGAGATVGAGSTITRDVADAQLSVARGKQRNLDNWPRPKKRES
jgi:bifunctional UDP-N-acetylglucosamine pyrophosphorylase / glucosamine-1-phosphate N-acetyltransferase